MLPIVQRELRTAVRHPKYYTWRVRLAVIELVAALMIVAGDKTMGTGRAGGFFTFLSWVAFLFCLFEGLRKTSDAISEEKREGTLGLLFLTDLNGFDVILGKLTGAMLRSFNALLIFVPILSITLILGGTTFAEFWRVVLALGSTLWLSMTLCLFASTLSQEKYLGASFSMICLLIAGSFVGAELLEWRGYSTAGYVRYLNPIAVFNGASDGYNPTNASRFWLGVGFQFLLGSIALILASLIVPHCWRDKPFKQTTALKSRTLGRPEVALNKRRKLLDENPILWLAYNERQHRLFSITFYSGLVLCLSLLIFTSQSGSAIAVLIVSLLILALLIFTNLASQASMNLNEAKRNGAMELLLSTPLKVANIVKGQWLALKKMFLLPVSIVLGGFILLILFTVVADDGSSFWTLKFLAEFVLEVFVLGWVGMWMGLSSKSPNRAFFRTLVIGLLIPFLFCLLPTLIIQVILLVFAMDRVTSNFRRFIAERYLQSPKFVLPPALASPPDTPPVIR